VAPHDVTRQDMFRQNLDLFMAIEKGNVRGDRIGIDDAHAPAERFVRSRQRELAADGVAVGPLVGSEQKRLVLFDDLNKLSPGYGHRFSFACWQVAVGAQVNTYPCRERKSSEAK